MTPEASALLLERGIRAFAEGRFFLAHELWEDVWRGMERSAPERRAVQALVQIAVGLHQLAMGRADVARRMLDRAIAKLDPTAMSPRLGVDLERVRFDTLAALAALERFDRAVTDGAAPVISIAIRAAR